MSDTVKVVVRSTTTKIIQNGPTTKIIQGGSPGPRGPAGPAGAASGGTYIASETLSALRAVRLSAAGEVALAQPTDVTPVIAVTMTAASASASVDVVELGTMQDASWNWTIGLPVVLGADGTLTQDMTGMTRLTVIGLPMAADSLYVRIQPVIRLV